MKLRKEEKADFRKKIEEKLEEVPQGTRIHIDKGLLEELLFDIILYDDEIGSPLKVPVWSGNFLSKIDLSEVSFEDVSWAAHNECCYESTAYEMHETSNPALLSALDRFYASNKAHEDEKIIYTNTNARIDFRKSYEYKKIKRIVIFYCNFNGTDLSENDMNTELDIRNTNISNTKIKITPLKKYNEQTKKEENLIFMYGTNLEGIDLSSFEVDYLSEEMVDWLSCNLKHTGIRINNLNTRTIAEGLDYDYEDIKEMIQDGDFDGCYINGNLIKSKEERQETARQMREKYQQFRDDLEKTTLTNIDDQIRGMKK